VHEVIEDAGQGRPEARQVAAAVNGVGAVGKGDNQFVVAIVVLHGRFDGGAVNLLGHVDNAGVDLCPAPVQIGGRSWLCTLEIERRV